MGAVDHDRNVDRLARSLTIDQAIEAAYAHLWHTIYHVVETYQLPYKASGRLCEACGYASERLYLELVRLGVPPEAAEMLARPE